MVLIEAAEVMEVQPFDLNKSTYIQIYDFAILEALLYTVVAAELREALV